MSMWFRLCVVALMAGGTAWGQPFGSAELRLEDYPVTETFQFKDPPLLPF